MKNLQIITACPTDTYFTWQVHLWLESLREIGLSGKAKVLLFNPIGRPKNNTWDKISSLYPESEIKIYEDDGSVAPLLKFYIPILRMYVMKKYFEEHPASENDAIFYCDSDIIFMNTFDISHLLDDDVNYLSDTNSYISADYFNSKVKDVLPEKLEEYKKIDVLDEAAKIVGVNREVCEKYNKHSGGTQYLLKNINSDFWQECFNKCLPLLSYLKNINKEYFANEQKGIQSWTTDMWIVLWQIWKTGADTKVVSELDFAWATDPISKLKKVSIFHNAGIVSEGGNGYPAFYKGKYHQGNNPFEDSHLQTVLNNEESKKHCTHFYVTQLLALKKKYNLNY